MNKLDITYLIETLEAAQRDLSPDHSTAIRITSTTRDVVAGRRMIDSALSHLRILRNEASKPVSIKDAVTSAEKSEPKKFPPVDEKGSPDLPWLGLPSLSAEDRHRRLEILKVCGNLATAKHWEAWITGTNHENGEVFQ